MDFLNTLLNNPTVISLSKTLLHFCWQGALIAGVLYLFLNSVDKKRAEVRYLGAIFSMVLFVLVPVFTFNYFYAAQVASGDIVNTTQFYIQDALLNIDQLELQTFLPFASVFWLAGVSYLTTRLCIEMFSVYQLPKRQVVPVEEQVQQLFDHVAEKLQVNRVVKVLGSTRAEVPMVIGWLRPVVLVPVSMLSGLSTAQLEMLFAHELGHVKRHDFLVNFLQTLVEILFFFHPCVKWVSKQVRIEREYCCDDIAVACCGNAHGYARTLAQAETIRKGTIPQLIMAATGGDLKERVLRMVQQSDCSDNFSHSWHSLALAGVFAVTLAVFTFYAQDGLQARFADTLGHERANNPILPEPDPVTKIEVAMEQGKGAETGTVSGVDAWRKDTPAPSNQQQLIANEGLYTLVSQSQQAEVAIEEGGLVEADEALTEQVEPAQLVAAVESQESSKVSQGIEESLAQIENLEVAAIQPVVVPEVETAIPEEVLPQVDPMNLEGFKRSPNALKVSLAKLNEKIQSEGFALSIESDKIAMAIAPETINAPIIVAPRLIRSAPPKYPRMAVTKGIEADVVVSFTVNSSGRIVDLHFENKVQGYFKRSVRQALNVWRFEPGSIDGEIANMSMQKVFSFSDPKNFAVNAGAMKTTGSRIAKDI